VPSARVTKAWRLSSWHLPSRISSVFNAAEGDKRVFWEWRIENSKLKINRVAKRAIFLIFISLL